MPPIVAEITGQTETALAVGSQTAPRSASDDDVTSFFDISQRVISARKLGQVLVLHEFGNVAVHVVNSPGVGQVGTNWRWTPTSPVVGRQVAVMKGIVFLVQREIRIFGLTMKFSCGISEGESRSAACPAGIFPLCLGWQPITGRIRVKTNHFFSLSPVEKRQTFLLAQPVAV